jgi:hypothetical protein
LTRTPYPEATEGDPAALAVASAADGDTGDFKGELLGLLFWGSLCLLSSPRVEFLYAEVGSTDSGSMHKIDCLRHIHVVQWHGQQEIPGDCVREFVDVEEERIR